MESFGFCNGSTQTKFCTTAGNIEQNFARALPHGKAPAKAAAEFDDDLFGGEPAESAADDEKSGQSSISSDEDDDESVALASLQGKGKALASGQALASSQGQGQAHVDTRHAKIRPARQGLAAEAWLAILNGFTPTQVVCAGPVTFQAGLISGLLQYNDQRFGLGLTTLIAFIASRPLQTNGGSMSKSAVKQLQAAHLSLHTVDAGLQGYLHHRQEVAAANLAKAAKPSSRKLMPRPTDESAGGTGEAAPELANFISILENEEKLLVVPPEGDDFPDSEDDDGQSNSSMTEQAVLSKRNARYFAKHGVKVQFVSDQIGLGLFATQDLATGLLEPPCRSGHVPPPARRPPARRPPAAGSVLRAVHFQLSSALLLHRTLGFYCIAIFFSVRAE